VLRLNPPSEIARSSLAWAQEHQGKKTATVSDWLSVSLQSYQAGHYQECLDAARQALTLDPTAVPAYNNVVACANKLGRLDEALAAGEAALRLEPENQLLKSNLAVTRRLTAKPETPRR
jgi:Flp pilus assembly protein TadD